MLNAVKKPPCIITFVKRFYRHTFQQVCCLHHRRKSFVEQFLPAHYKMFRRTTQKADLVHFQFAIFLTIREHVCKGILDKVSETSNLRSLSVAVSNSL